MKKLVYILLTLLIVFSAIPANAYESPAEISIKDYSGVITDNAKEYINSKNETLFSQCGAKVIFVTVPSTDGMKIDDFTDSLYSEMEIAKLGKRNSVFFVIDTNNNEYSFSIGKSIRYALTEPDMYKYIVDYFEPYFSEKQYTKAIVSLYNAVSGWYETKYNNVSLNIDDDIHKYITGKITKDTAHTKNYLWLWIGLGICVILLITGLKIKRNIELRIRKMERRRLRKKFKIDIDKIVNS